MIELIQTDDRVISVDIVGSFAALDSAEETKYPVEDGSRRADHKIFNPRTVELEISQTETPLDDPDFEVQDVTVSFGANTSRAFKPGIKFREVQTVVLSPFLLVEGAIRDLATSVISSFRSEPSEFEGQTLGPFAEQSLTQSAYKANNPRDRGAELADLLEELYFDAEATCAITYRGRTYSDLSLVSFGVTYERAGVTVYPCSFEQRRTASIGTTMLFDPQDVAHKASQSQGKGRSKERGAGSERPKSVLRAITS